jgi:hypothetical protein
MQRPAPDPQPIGLVPLATDGTTWASIVQCCGG